MLFIETDMAFLGYSFNFFERFYAKSADPLYLQYVMHTFWGVLCMLFKVILCIHMGEGHTFGGSLTNVYTLFFIRTLKKWLSLNVLKFLSFSTNFLIFLL